MMKSISLADGTAELMGDGVALVLQNSDQGPQSVALTVADLRAVLDALGG